MSENKPEEQDGYAVPGRVSLDDLHRESAELKAARAAEGPKKPLNLLSATGMFSAATDFALIIAIPIIAFTQGGIWLDKRQGTKYYVVVGLLVAIVISSFGIYRQIQSLQKTLKKL